MDAALSNALCPADAYEVYLVPIINIDGYLRTNGDQCQRQSANGVDLTRNWPSPYWNYDNSSSGSKKTGILQIEPQRLHGSRAKALYGDSQDPLSDDYKRRFVA
ncbi:hypothetical protein H310_12034 [Aphanomyces invadans]|uniref:Peptidase M14 domain-containing protein n=1 Tax=Aphanomyces invadans TaxID=157072 RepID=A0A024TJW0_9STRA|nr:hypothetical protein H310_12034 [Aphanomyces invadans]XP_008881368.1 hypothetical protein H310_15159 [Aphanomyces invadans]ETV90002.1 hypothetical protein H310_15159 [Aphanomyces invadans]ETV94405.1 hypothetical protein H310_12034 [Aphanomyces invadans]|eukprot:XP_008877167.1 hypothetical protein H310_12034 [Aphanomyces invadans]